MAFVYRTLKFLSDFITRITKDKRKLLLNLILIILTLFFLTRYQAIFFTILLILIGGLSMLYIRYFRFSHYVGFELCIMATVITALKFGPAFGFITGLFSISLGFALSGYFKPSYFISVLTLPLLGLVIPIFSYLPLWQTGIIITILYDLIILPLYVVMGSRIPSTIIFFITHIILNYWVFTTIAPFIFSVI